MAIYNISNATNTVDLMQLAKAIDDLSATDAVQHVFGTMFFLTVIGLIFLTMRVKTQVENSVLIATVSWFAVIFSLMLRAIDLIGASIVVVSLVVSIFSVALLYRSK